LVLQVIWLLISSTYSKSELETLASSRFFNKKSMSFTRNKSKASVTNTLHQNPLRLMHLEKEKVLIKKIKFMWQQTINQDPLLSLNKFDYKAIQINMENIVIFDMDQTLTHVEEANCNAEHYLMTIQLHNIDLPCNDNLYVCSLGELRSEYQRKMEGVDFAIAKKVVDDLTEDVAETKCLAITVGPFNSLSEIGYMCFDIAEDYIFYSNLISERIFKNQNKRTYDGQVELLNPVILLFFYKIRQSHLFQFAMINTVLKDYNLEFLA